MTDAATPADVPGEAASRLERPAFSSGLTVPDFAACLQMGMRPVGLVQGFCVMRWSWYGPGTGYGYAGPVGAYGGGYGGWGNAGLGSGQGRGPRALHTYNCPHSYVSAEHRAWGSNYEQPWVAKAWSDGWNAAYHRMVEEATLAGAHGVIGVVDTASHLIDSATQEFHFLGTAVVVDGAEPPPRPWTTYLAGQRLAKLVEAGYMPVNVVGTLASVRMWEVCVTEILLGGRQGYLGAATTGMEIQQLADARMDARRRARHHIRSQLGGDELHGAQLFVHEAEVGAGDRVVTATLKGTRVHRFKDADPLAPPRPTVRLA